MLLTILLESYLLLIIAVGVGRAEGDGGVRGGGSAGHHQLRPLEITVEPDELITSAQLPGLCNNKSKDLLSNVHAGS